MSSMEGTLGREEIYEFLRGLRDHLQRRFLNLKEGIARTVSQRKSGTERAGAGPEANFVLNYVLPVVKRLPFNAAQVRPELAEKTSVLA